MSRSITATPQQSANVAPDPGSRSKTTLVATSMRVALRESGCGKQHAIGAHHARTLLTFPHPHNGGQQREGAMGEIKLFQICYEGELTLAVSQAMRRLGAEPNFDQSWQVWLPEGRHAAALVRYLRANLGDESRLIVGGMQFTT